MMARLLALTTAWMDSSRSRPDWPVAGSGASVGFEQPAVTGGGSPGDA